MTARPFAWDDEPEVDNPECVSESYGGPFEVNDDDYSWFEIYEETPGVFTAELMGTLEKDFGPFTSLSEAKRACERYVEENA